MLQSIQLEDVILIFKAFENSPINIEDNTLSYLVRIGEAIYEFEENQDIKAKFLVLREEKLKILDNTIYLVLSYEGKMSGNDLEHTLDSVKGLLELAEVQNYDIELIYEGTINYLIKLLKNLRKNKNRNVLIVDDSIVVRKVQKQILSKVMLNIDEAKNGKEAIEKINKNKYDLIITDINMPIMNGEELIKRIREKYSIDELPILVVSGNNENSLIKCLKLGANDFIKKPFSAEELKVRVNNIFELYEHIKRILKSSRLDKLTAVYNRNFLENNFEEIFNSNEYKSIAMLDIDRFKQINDTYGHQVGDEILRYFASTIKDNIRKSDLVIRYGGEEFIVFLPESYKEEALIVLHKIKKALRPYKDINFTFSAGIADEGKTLAEMIKLADERLYKAKKEGRNRIISK
jgi:diguanylate cyclase (GGDEF)-like protein